MAEVIEKAKQKLREAEAEVERLRSFISTYAALAGSDDAISESPSGDSGDDPSPTATPAEIVQGAREAMKERGRPLSRSQIVKILRDKGFLLPGKDATKNIGTVIWRSKQFDNIAGHGYWPKDFARWIGQRSPEYDLLLS